MAEVNNINVYIDTSKRSSGQLNHHMYFSFEDQYINCDDSQGLRVNFVHFSSINSFFNTNQYNNSFTIMKTTLSDVIIQSYKFDIPYGNYNVYTFRDYINSICGTYFTMTYNVSTNSYSITRTLVDTTVKIKLYMNTAGVFFGIKNDATILLTSTPYNTSFVNMTGWNKLIMRIKGVQFEDPAIDNIASETFEESEILFWISRMDKYPFCELIYNDEDNGDLFNYKIHNKHVRNIELILTDEYNNLLTDCPDWKGIIQFEVYNRSNDEQTSLLKSINLWLRMINAMFLMVLEHLKII